MRRSTVPAALTTSISPLRQKCPLTSSHHAPNALNPHPRGRPVVFSSEDQGLAALPPGGFDRRWSAREVERVENRLDDRTLPDQGDHLTSSTAGIAAKHVLLEDSLHQFGPADPPATSGRPVATPPEEPTIGGEYQGTPGGIRSQDAVIADLVDPGAWHDGGQPGDEIQRIEHQGLRTIGPRPGELQAEPPVLPPAEPTGRHRGASQVTAEPLELPAIGYRPVQEEIESMGPTGKTPFPRGEDGAFTLDSRSSRWTECNPAAHGGGLADPERGILQVLEDDRALFDRPLALQPADDRLADGRFECESILEMGGAVSRYCTSRASRMFA